MLAGAADVRASEHVYQNFGVVELVHRLAGARSRN
jgi:hypothetical protein